MKKLFSLLLVCALAFTMSVSAFAAEGAPSTEKEPPAQTEVDATTRAADIPTESVALPYERGGHQPLYEGRCGVCSGDVQ